MLGIKLKAELGDEVELSLEKVDVILIVLHQLLEQIAAHVVLDCMTMGRGFLVKRARRMPPHVGRGVWTWYTGSAGWMYNLALEWILGFRVRGASFVLDPCILRAWPKFEISFRHRSARYDITVENPLGVCRSVIAVKLDGRC